MQVGHTANDASGMIPAGGAEVGAEGLQSGNPKRSTVAGGASALPLPRLPWPVASGPRRPPG
jgi:hypothetical protein